MAVYACTCKVDLMFIFIITTYIIYPMNILDADINSIVNKVFHNVWMATSSCNVQGSQLMERNRLVTKVAQNFVTRKPQLPEELVPMHHKFHVLTTNISD